MVTIPDPIVDNRAVRRKYNITQSDKYSGGSEDTAHNFENVRFVCYWEGTNHAADDSKAYLRRSYDRGITWQPREVLAEATGKGAFVFSCGILRGRRFWVERNSTISGGIDSLVMYSRRVDGRAQMDPCFQTFSGTKNIRVHTNKASQDGVGTPWKHGLMNGDYVSLTGVGFLETGPGITGNYVVSNVTDTTFDIVATVGTNASADATGLGPTTGTPTFMYIYEARCAKQEVLFGSGMDRFDAALLIAKPGQELLPAAVKSFVPIGDNAFCVAVAGAGIRGLVRIDNVFSGSRLLSYFNFPAVSSKSDVSLCGDGTYMYGWTRNDLRGSSGVLTVITNPGSTPPAFDKMEWPEDNLAYQNPIPMRYHAGKDLLVACAMDRYPDENNKMGHPPTGDVTRNNIYIMVAKPSDVRDALDANSEQDLVDAFRKYLVDDVMTGGIQGGPSASGCGTPSLDIDGDTIIVYYGEERRRTNGFTEDSNETPLTPDIMAIELDISSFV